MSETTSEVETVTVEIKYVRGAHNRDEPAIDRDEDPELWDLTRDLGSFTSEAFDRNEISVEDALETAYVSLDGSIELNREVLGAVDGIDVENPKTVAEYVHSRLQGPAVVPELGYDGRYTRSLAKGDVVVVDGTAVMIEGFGTTVLASDVN